MPKIKTPTQKEKIEVYERLLHDIQFHAEVTMRPEQVRHLIGLICGWSYSHRSGEKTEQERQEAINFAFQRLSTRK